MKFSFNKGFFIVFLIFLGFLRLVFKSIILCILYENPQLRNPAIDGDWVPYPEDALGERGRFLVRLADDKAYSLGVIDNYYFHGGCCYEATNPEVGLALQSLYAELIVKYTPEGDEAQLAAE